MVGENVRVWQHTLASTDVKDTTEDFQGHVYSTGSAKG